MSYQQIYFVIPTRILELPKITLSLVRFYETIFQFWNNRRQCFLSNDEIKKRTGIKSDSTINKAFEFFERHNEMKRKIENGQRLICSIDEKIYIKPVDNFEKSVDKPLDVARPRSRYIETQGLATSRHNSNNINNNNLNKNICTNDQNKTKGFEEFWIMYPVKNNRRRAEQEWIRQRCTDSFDKIHENVRYRVKNDQRWRTPQFVPDPFSFLRDHRWKDETCEIKSIVHEYKQDEDYKPSREVALRVLDEIKKGLGMRRMQ